MAVRRNAPVASTTPRSHLLRPGRIYYAPVASTTPWSHLLRPGRIYYAPVASTTPRSYLLRPGRIYASVVSTPRSYLRPGRTYAPVRLPARSTAVRRPFVSTPRSYLYAPVVSTPHIRASAVRRSGRTADAVAGEVDGREAAVAQQRRAQRQGLVGGDAVPGGWGVGNRVKNRPE